MRWSTVAFFVLVGLVGVPRETRADSTAAETAAARTLGQDGVMLADQGKCDRAIEKLDRAEKLRHAPTTAVRLGECEINVGKVIAGTERLQRLLREGLPNNAPKSFVTAMERAQRVLDAGLPKIASLRVTLKMPKDAKDAKPSVTIDEEPLKDALIGTDSPVDPGAHVVTAKAVGFLPATEKVDLRDGETRGITLTLQVDPNYKPEPPPKPITSTTTAPPVTAADTSSPAASPWPWVAFGVGAVGIGVGAVTGIIVAGKKSDLDAGCEADGRCPSTQKSTLDSANTMATISTIGFIVGGVGVASGIVLLVTGWGKPSATTGSGAPAKTAGVQPIVGAGYAGLGGTF